MKTLVVTFLCSLSLSAFADVNGGLDNNCSDQRLQVISNTVSQTLSYQVLREANIVLKRCNLDEKQSRDTREYALDLLLHSKDRKYALDRIYQNLP